jgi:hypothetical protein
MYCNHQVHRDFLIALYMDTNTLENNIIGVLGSIILKLTINKQI